jgi:NifB/MoaA-like Fe-S oxidoreductase
MQQLGRLSTEGIQFHCQMVIVPGLNDGAVLEESLSDLWSLGEAVLSTAVVPVGLTQFSHLYTGERMDRPTANTLLEAVERWSERGKRERGAAWVHGSDELYLLAGRDLPDAEHYGDFPQIENGIGAVTYLRERVREGVSELPRLDGMRIGVVTGTAMSAMLPALLEQLRETTGAVFDLITVENSLFGPTTTVAGLLVGADMRRALDERSDLDLALIPAESINENGLFLDDDTLDAVAAAVPVPMHPSYDFIDVLSAMSPTLTTAGA